MKVCLYISQMPVMKTHQQKTKHLKKTYKEQDKTKTDAGTEKEEETGDEWEQEVF